MFKHLISKIKAIHRALDADQIGLNEKKKLSIVFVLLVTKNSLSQNVAPFKTAFIGFYMVFVIDFTNSHKELFVNCN